MDAEVRPEPTEEERLVIAAALESLEAERGAAAWSRWREAAWLEATTAAEPPVDP